MVKVLDIKGFKLRVTSLDEFNQYIETPYELGCSEGDIIYVIDCNDKTQTPYQKSYVVIHNKFVYLDTGTKIYDIDNDGYVQSIEVSDIMDMVRNNDTK